MKIKVNQYCILKRDFFIADKILQKGTEVYCVDVFIENNNAWIAISEKKGMQVHECEFGDPEGKRKCADGLDLASAAFANLQINKPIFCKKDNVFYKGKTNIAPSNNYN